MLSEPEFPKNPEELRAEYNDEIQNSEENVNFEEDEIRDSESDEIFDNTDNEIRNSEIMESESGPGPEQELLLDETQIRQIMGVPHLASEGMYEDILPGVDLHYTIEGERIKENIRLKTKEAAGYPLKFHFKHNGMVMKKRIRWKSWSLSGRSEKGSCIQTGKAIHVRSEWRDFRACRTAG